MGHIRRCICNEFALFITNTHDVRRFGGSLNHGFTGICSIFHALIRFIVQLGVVVCN